MGLHMAENPKGTRDLDQQTGIRSVHQWTKGRTVRIRKQISCGIRAQIVEEKKSLAAGFIRECQYTEWLANVVLVHKSFGAWRMCIDFTDLIKVCPKDDFRLPKIDTLVDSTAGHALFNFMESNAGYHQIPMAEKDQVHTNFTTSSDISFYNVMPFGLKKVGATY